jgi:uncharacterized DUF497 family protein
MIRNFFWNEEKNDLLKKTRGVSFEQIVTHILQGDLLQIEEHPNQERYPEQKYFIVRIDDYAYVVPFLEKGNDVVLKTIYSSRRATRQYIRRFIK